MAHLFRLIVAALLAVFSLVSHAAVPTVYNYKAGFTGAVFESSIAAACEDARVFREGAGSPFSGQVSVATLTGITTTSATAGVCQISVKRVSDGLTQAGNVNWGGTAGFCPANSTLSGGTCNCNSGYSEDATHTSCVLPPDPCASLAGLSAGDWWKDMGVNAAGTGPQSRTWSTCDGYNTVGGGKCIATVSNSECRNSDTDGMSGFWKCTGKAVYTGTSAVAGKCDAASSSAGDGSTPQSPTPSTPPVAGSDPPKAPANPAPGTSAPAPCPAGQAPGSVNGTSSCYPTGSDVPKAGGSDSSTTLSDGTKVTQHDETTCNAGGSKCSTDTTKCTTAPGSSTPTCTTTNSTDTATGTCAKSPGNSVCGGGNGGPGSSFTGTCAAGFKAVGDDPILNAMAQEQYKRNCETFRTDTEPSTWVVAEGQKTGNAMDGNPNNGTVNIGPGNFDQSDALGGGGCNLNKTVVVRGYSVALPFNVLCDPLAVLGQILVAVSLLLAARIVTRG